MKHVMFLCNAGRSRAGLMTIPLLFALPLAAQESPTNDDEPVKLSSMVVTGSNLPLAGETPVAPVTVISPADIERTGITNDLLQVIRKTAPQFTGNGNLGADNGNISSGSTNGGSALSLRNVATLVLVNGRRLAVAPVGATTPGVFVDVNAIPVSAIARIEILTDGASAIYGTDAVSGVVNIILKTDYRGAEVGARFARTDNLGHYSERSAWGVAGGQLGRNGPNVTISYEWTKVDPVYNYQRPFATPSYGTTNFAGAIQVGAYDENGNFVGDPNGYYFLDPSLGAPKAGATLAERGYTGPFTTGEILRKFDLSQFVTMLIENEKKIFTVSADQRISDRLTLFGDLIFSRTETLSQLNAQPLTIRMQASDPNNVLGRDVSVRNRFVDFPRQYIADTDSLRGILGAKGRLNDQWSWETALNYSEGVQDFANANLVRTAARVAAVNSGAINLFARQQPASALNGLFGAAAGTFTSKLQAWDFKFVGTDLFHAPGGGVSLAVGFETRQESLDATSDVDSQSATFAYDSGTTIDPFDQRRHITSAFAEVNIPLVGAENRRPGIYSADLTLAGRHERYSDTNDPTVPKIALRWQPFDDSLLLRATYSRSFAAPTLYQIHSPTGIGFSGVLAEFDSNQANLLTTAVSGLKPSRSTNYSAGVVWTPKGLSGLSVSVDYFNLKQTDVVSNLNNTGVVDQVFHDVEVKGSASQYASLIHVGSFTGPTITEPGQISTLGLDNIFYVIPGASNIGTTKLSGFDLKFTYDLPVGDGRIRFENSDTYYLNYDVQVTPGAPFTPTVGRVTGLNGTIPRWRAYSVITYSQKNFSADVANTFYTATTDTTWTPDFAPDYQQNIPSYSTWDVSASYRLKGRSRWFKEITLTAGVNNIGNRMPTKSATFDSLSNADITEFNPIGRLYYVTAKYRF